jgi:cell division protein FtsB
MTDALKQRLLKKREGMGRTRTSSNLPSSAPSSLRQSSTFEDSGEIVVVPKSRPSRNNVAVAGRATFTGTKKKTDKLPAPIRYLGLGKATSKSKRKNKKFFDHLVVFGWICMALLGVRLLLSDRGIIDFYKHKAVLESIHHDIEQLKVDNGELMAEIEKIRSSSRYQKKIVRDYLGFIAKNEYLILFAKGRSPANSTN